jgi:tetratricopeptide (TPR) repeat protein
VITKKDKYLAAAQKFLERGQLDKALAEFARVVQEDPKDTRTWLKMAELHAKRGAAEQATEIYLKTGELYTEQGFFQKAVAVYKNVLKLSPGYVQGHFKLAEVFKRLGLLSDAVQQYELAAAVYHRAGKPAEVLTALRQIVDMQPDNVVSRIKLAEAASQAGATDEAVRELGKAAEQLKAQGRTDEYIRVAERLLFHQPENLTVGRELAESYIVKNNARLALPRLQACLKADARDPLTVSLLARAFEQLGQVPKAISVLRELAHLCHDLGRIGERDAAIRKALALDPRDFEAQEAARQYGIAPGAGRGGGGGGGEGLPRLPGVPPRLPPGVGDSSSGMRTPPPPVGIGGMKTGTGASGGGFGVGAGSGGAGGEARPVTGLRARHPALSQGGSTDQDVARIMAESEVFIKYGLLERAADHLRRVFDLQPNNVPAHEKLAAVLVQLGRTPDAAKQMEEVAHIRAAPTPPPVERTTTPPPPSVPAENAMLTPPPAAADRRFLDDDLGFATPPPVDPEATPPPVVALPAVALGSGPLPSITPAPQVTPAPVPAAAAAAHAIDAVDAHADDTAELEVDDLQIEVADFDDQPAAGLAAEDDDPLAGEETPPPVPQQTIDRIESMNDDIDRHLAAFDDDDPAATIMTPSPFASSPPGGQFEPQPSHPMAMTETEEGIDIPTPPPVIDHGFDDQAPTVIGGAINLIELEEELEQVDFFMTQGLPEDARALLEELELRYGSHPMVLRKMAEMERMADRTPATPMRHSPPRPPTPVPGALPRFGTGEIGDTPLPRAMVAGGESADHSTHGDLGIAYKEMGLFDPAIAEFKLLADDPQREVFALTMIGECFEAKGSLTDAVIRYKEALNCPQVRPEEITQLYFCLGSAFERLHDPSEALYFYEKVAKRDPKFREVDAKVAALKPRNVRRA